MPADLAGSRATLARLAGEPHRRYNPLIDEWVLVSAGRTNRPWLGAEEPEPEGIGVHYDPGCYLCPGNVRANGHQNPDYPETYVFTNDFSALRPDTAVAVFDDGLLRAEGERGLCRVVCFSPRHDLTLGIDISMRRTSGWLMIATGPLDPSTARDCTRSLANAAACW